MTKRTRSERDDDEVAPTSAAGGGRGGNGDKSNRRTRAGELKFKGDNSTATTNKRPPSSTVLPVLSLEGSLSEEILLRVLSFLNSHDLVTVARVSSAWHRLSYDPQLWRELYLRTYASPATHRRAASGGHVVRTRPWRELYKISSNWRNGSARISTLGKGIRRAVLAEAPPEVSLSSAPDDSHGPAVSATDGDETPDTLLQFHQHFFFTASRSPSSLPSVPPSVTIHQTLPSGESAVIGSVSSSALRDHLVARPDFRAPLSITELRLDESPPSTSSASPLLLAIFYSSGHFSLFRITLPSSSPPLSFSAREAYSSLALDTPPSYSFSLRPPTTHDPVHLARLYSPLLVTCSESLTMRFWRVEEGKDGDFKVEEADTPLQTSERGWKPVVLSLAEIEADEGKEGEEGWGTKRWKEKERLEVAQHDQQCFRATLAYSTPVFPASWTVGLQEFLITVPPASTSFDASPPVRPRLSISARHATALPLDTPLPPTPRRSSPLPSRSSAYTMPRNPVTSIEHSHPFVVASRRDNQLDVYEVVSSPSTSLPSPPLPPFSSSSRFRIFPSTPSPTQLKLEHRRTLFGHTARVAGVALLAGTANTSSGNSTSSVRCVSAGDDGAVKVWELTPTRSSRGDSDHISSSRKRRRVEEPVIDIEVLPSAAAEEGQGETAWQRMKRRRLSGVHGKESASAVAGASALTSGSGGRPERIKRVLVGEDKIVLVGAGGGGGGGGEERVRVLRFD